MESVILISLDDSEDSPITAWARTPHVTSLRSQQHLGFYMRPVTSTSGTAVVLHLSEQRADFQIVDEETLSELEDEIDVQEALEALSEAREKGTISHDDLKAKLGLT